MAHIDKVIISSDAALAGKYGAGATRVAAAVTALIAADAARGLTTQYVAVDGPLMSGFGAARVPMGAPESAYKAAVDAIHASAAPDYIVVLGAPDVFPHQTLVNPLYSPPADPDQTIPSDLPYACSAPYSSDPSRFMWPDRVVGRIPDVQAGADSSYLETLLAAAAGATPQSAGTYGTVLGISARVWQGSTSMSLNATFGSAVGLQLSPSNGPAWTAPQMNCRSHFVNCHGAPGDPQFYGQQGNTYPSAHQAALIAGSAAPETIVAAECCYGAELYDPAVAGHQSIANTYLERGAFGFFGSTNIAYGPATSMGYADVICAAFFRHLLGGASLGAAVLAARQDYVHANSPLDPTSIKTLAQFLLLGDPSIHPVPGAHTFTSAVLAKGAAEGAAAAATAADARAGRRKQAAIMAQTLADTTAVSDATPRPEANSGLLAEVKSRAGASPSSVALTFNVRAPRREASFALPSALAKRAPVPEAFHVVFHNEATNGGVTQTLATIETEVAGKITEVRTVHAK